MFWIKRQSHWFYNMEYWRNGWHTLYWCLKFSNFTLKQQGSQIWVSPTISTNTYFLLFFFKVGPPKEDIFSGQLLSPIFQSSYTLQLQISLVTIWRQLSCIPVYDMWVLQGFCLLFCADSHTMLVWHPSNLSIMLSGPSILKSLFLWWLSLEDVGLQISL